MVLFHLMHHFQTDIQGLNLPAEKEVIAGLIFFFLRPLLTLTLK